MSSQAAELQRTTSSKLKRTMSAPRNRREISRPYGGVIGQSKPSAAVSSPPKHDAIMLSVSFALGLISPRGEKRKLSTGKYSNGSSQQSSPTHSESPEQFRSKSEPNSPRVLSRHPSASITAIPLTKLVRNRVESRFSLSLSLSLSLTLTQSNFQQLSRDIKELQELPLDHPFCFSSGFQWNESAGIPESGTLLDILRVITISLECKLSC